MNTVIHAARRRSPALGAVLALGLLTCPAAAAPSSLTGEWYWGNVYPGSAYTVQGFQQASTDAERLLLRPNGTYELATLDAGASPGTFGWTGYMISCETISLRLESGKFSVEGSKLTLKPGALKNINLASPHTVNRGCTQSSGLTSNGPLPAVRRFTWKIAGTTLTLTSPKDTFQVRRASAQDLQRVNTSTARPTLASAVSTPPPPPPPAPVRADASGKWTGRFTSDAGAPLDVRLNLEDDRLGIQGMVLSAQEQYLGTARGEYRAGTLILTINLPDDTALELHAQGRFDGDTYTGRFQGQTASGQLIGGGQVKLTREPLPVRLR